MVTKKTLKKFKETIAAHVKAKNANEISINVKGVYCPKCNLEMEYSTTTKSYICINCIK